MTIADMSIIEAELEVDETDIPNVKLGQSAKVTIDAIPDKTFVAKVTEIGNSPIQATAAAATRATNFKGVVTIEGEVPEVRPGFTCTADITTATRKGVVAIPIQATTVRELVFDEKGNVVKEPAPTRRSRSGRARRRSPMGNSSRARRGRKPRACSPSRTARPPSCPSDRYRRREVPGGSLGRQGGRTRSSSGRSTRSAT